MDSIVVYQTKEETDGKPLRELDNQNTVLAILASDVKPVKIVAVGRKISYFFFVEEAEAIMSQMLSNTPMIIDYNKVVLALEHWKNSFITAKAKMKEQGIFYN